VLEIITLSILAGIIGMGVGSVLTAMFGGRSDKLISIFLSFAGGVMLSIVFIDLLPEALELMDELEFFGFVLTTVGLIAGVLLVLVSNNIMDKISKSGKIHSSFAEFFHEGEVISGKSSLVRSGMIMLFALALHNIPEGLAMGVAGVHDASLGYTIALLIGFHNIPEGMAISAPLIAGGISKLKTIVLVMLCGATTLLGTIAGIIIGDVSEVAVALSFAIASGAMLYVVFSEILPHCIINNKDRLPTVFILVGIILGMLFSGIV